MKNLYSPLRFHTGYVGELCVYYLYFVDEEIDPKTQNDLPEVIKLIHWKKARLSGYLSLD